ncbi:unnamed protein product [Cyprideis torosa]|uniref:Ion transport domain-containing protein n=1 Tax=Cyprideis torosa TaxID=163714 RepID=A0A7R8ZKL8_9CRUS|nr:unnamed protein product [Cyprideis torosa]CAG0880517.1 unnamed protein product [Cyprideis torosa]
MFNWFASLESELQYAIIKGIPNCLRRQSRRIMGNCAQRLRGSHKTPGAILDRVISQASEQDDCLLYKLANYKGGGELVDAYNIGGSAEVDALIREQFGVFMYNNGKGRTITETDYLKWYCRGKDTVRKVGLRWGFMSGYSLVNGNNGKGRTITKTDYLKWYCRGKDTVSLTVDENFNRYDPLLKWRDHEGCWKMDYRGSLGETLLHVLIICNTRLHTKLAKILLQAFPKLALDVVEGEEYLGASPLHLAIAYNNVDFSNMLIDVGADVNQRAIGSFFQPYDQQGQHPKSQTTYEGLAYFGEYPLVWAACCNNEAVYNYLLEHGGDPNIQDQYGNMVLHLLVVNDNLDMYGYSLRHPRKRAENGILNKAGLTPLTLACKLGRSEIFQEMMELSAVEFWRYSNITCSGYPLNAVDTILPSGKINHQSALMIILSGEKAEHLDMLEGGVVQRILEEKWKTFARLSFLKRLLICFLHLITLGVAVVLRGESLTDGESWSEVDIVRYCAELSTCLGCLFYCVISQGSELMLQGVVVFTKNLLRAPAKCIFFISNIMLLSIFPFRVLGHVIEDCRMCTYIEEQLLAVAVPGSWFFLMFFAGAVRLTGPFVTMIFSMITGDMFTFGIIYGIMLLFFSQAYFFLYRGHSDFQSTKFAGYHYTWMGLFHTTLGEYDMDMEKTAYPIILTLVFCTFQVIVPILLLNMLIAMMGNTYALVIQQSEKEFVKQWANIVINLERAVSQEKAKEHLIQYSIKLGSGKEDGTEQRAVMVIRSKNKTRARQRKGALSNWKRLGRVLVDNLRHYQCNAWDLRTYIIDGENDGIIPGRGPIKPMKKGGGGPKPPPPGGGGQPPGAAGAAGLAPSGTATEEEEGPPPSAPSWLTGTVDNLAWQNDLNLDAKGGGGESTGDGGGLTGALSQLAFTNDLNLGGVDLPSSAAPATSKPVGSVPASRPAPAPATTDPTATKKPIATPAGQIHQKPKTPITNSTGKPTIVVEPNATKTAAQVLDAPKDTDQKSDPKMKFKKKRKPYRLPPTPKLFQIQGCTVTSSLESLSGLSEDSDLWEEEQRQNKNIPKEKEDIESQKIRGKVLPKSQDSKYLCVGNYDVSDMTPPLMGIIHPELTNGTIPGKDPHYSPLHDVAKDTSPPDPKLGRPTSVPPGIGRDGLPRGEPVHETSAIMNGVTLHEPLVNNLEKQKRRPWTAGGNLKPDRKIMKNSTSDVQPISKMLAWTQDDGL